MCIRDRCVVGQIKRHQRIENQALRQGSENALAIRCGRRDGGHRWTQIGHDNGPSELARTMRKNSGKCFVITQMQVPVVGTGDGDLHSEA